MPKLLDTVRTKLKTSMIYIYVFCFLIVFQINIYTQQSNDSSSIVISPIICEVFTEWCWNDSNISDQFKIVITCEGIDHIYNRIFFQKVFLDPEGWKATSLEEIKINSEEDELSIQNAMLYCEDGLTYLEFDVQDFWSEKPLEKYKLVLTTNGYSFIK